MMKKIKRVVFMSTNHTDEQNAFEQFLIIMDDQLESLEEDAKKFGISLDLSVSSINKLELLFELMAENADKDTVDSLVVYFGRYLGEIVIHNYGGQWELPLDDPNNVNYNTPVITGHSQKGLEFAPLSVIRSFSLRRVENTLQRAIDADMKIRPLDLSNLIEE